MSVATRMRLRRDRRVVWWVFMVVLPGMRESDGGWWRSQCMCRWPPPPAVRVAGIRTRATAAKATAMTAAPMNPRENASAAPLAVVNAPALLATADRTATPRAAPISCPVIRKPEATPAWEAGMPAIEVTETGTKTMPMPRPIAEQAGKQVGGVVGGAGGGGEQDGSGGGDQQSGRGDAARRHVLEQVAGHDGADGDGEGERQEGESRFQGGVSEDGLQEDRHQEHGADEDAGDAEHHGGAGDEGLELPHVRGEQGLARGLLDLEEDRHQEGRDAEGCHGRDGPPAMGGGAAKGVDEGGEAGDDGGGAGQVEVRQAGSGHGLLGDDAVPDDQGDEADRAVDPEDELPAGPGGDGPAEEDAGGDAEAADRSPQGERGLALGAGVRRHDQGECGGGEQGGAEALDGAGGDQLGAVVGEPADQRGQREQPQAGEEDASSGQEVGDAATEQEASAGHHQVGGDQPLEVFAGEAEVPSDAGQCGVDDGDVEDDQDLGGQGDGEQGPRGAVALLLGVKDGLCGRVGHRNSSVVVVRGRVDGAWELTARPGGSRCGRRRGPG